jgi:hypothetical protein
MRRILTAKEQLEMLAPWRRTAGPVFDWRPTPEYAALGLTLDHHTAPLENGDRLHVYRPDFPGAGMTDKHWLYELEPHDMAPRLPLVWHDHVDPGTGRAPGVMHMIIGRNPEVDPPDGPDRRRRNLSLWGRGADEVRPHENGRTFPTAEEAMQAAEQRYREEAPKWDDRAPHARGDLSRGFDYDGFFSNPPPSDDGNGFDIFGDRP